MSVFVHESLGLGEGGQWPAVVQVALLHRGVEVVVDEVGRCGHAQIPAKSLQQQKLHLDQILFVQDQVEAAHEAQRVQLLQFRNAVLFLLKFTWRKEREIKKKRQVFLISIQMYCRIIQCAVEHDITTAAIPVLSLESTGVNRYTGISHRLRH